MENQDLMMQRWQKLMIEYACSVFYKSEGENNMSGWSGSIFVMTSKIEYIQKEITKDW